MFPPLRVAPIRVWATEIEKISVAVYRNKRLRIFASPMLRAMKPKQSQIVLRDATMGDLDLLLHWEKQPHMLETVGEGWGWAEDLKHNPPWREQLIAELAGKAIGFLQIIDPAAEETHYWGEVAANLRAIDIFIGEVEYLGQGYGTLMMQQALERCFADPKVRAVLVDPLPTNSRAHKFYEKIGFKFVEERIMPENDLCRIYQLQREDWKKEM
jgi:aminoglycoside 6'-N-acetyltransferase